MSSITPVISSLPSGNDYKNYNILKFKGLNCNENPFDVEAGECCDMKNLYINDEMTLTTRPRLEWSKNIPSGFTKIIWTDNRFFIGLDDDSVCAKLFTDQEHNITLPTNLTKDTKFTIVKNSEDEYLLISTIGYYYLDSSNYTFKIVNNSEKAYIPTVKTGLNFEDPDSGYIYQEENALSNKIKREYIFDILDSNIPKSFAESELDFTNVFSKTNTELDIDFKIPSTTYFTTYNINKSSSGKYQLIRSGDTFKFVDFSSGVKIYNVDNITASHLTNSSNLLARYVYPGRSNNFYYLDIIDLSYTGETHPRDTSRLHMSHHRVFFRILNNSISFWMTFILKYAVLDGSDDDKILWQNGNGFWGPGPYFIPKDDTNTSYYITTATEIEYINRAEGIIDSDQIDSNKLELKLWSYDLTEESTIPIFDWTEESTIPSLDWADSYFDNLHNIVEKTHLYHGKMTSMSPYGQSSDFWDDIGLLYNELDGLIYYKTTRVRCSEEFENGSTPCVVGFNGTITFDTTTHQYTFVDGTMCVSKLYDSDMTKKGFYNTYTTRFFENIGRISSSGIFLSNGTSKLLFINNKNNVYANTLLNPEIDGSVQELSNLILSYDIEQSVLNNKKPSINYYNNKNLWFNEDSTLTTNIFDTNSLQNIPVFSTTTTKTIYESFTVNNHIYALTNTGIINIHYDPNNKLEPIVSVISSITDHENINNCYCKTFNNKLCLYGENNKLNITENLSGFYIPISTYDVSIGNNDKITSVSKTSDYYLSVFKSDKAYLLTFKDGYLSSTELKTELGNIPENQSIVSTYDNNTIVINNNGIYGILQKTNVNETDNIFYSLTDKITRKYVEFPDKSKIKSHNHRYYTYFYYNKNVGCDLLVLDNRTSSWYYWELPISIDFIYEDILISNDDVETISRIMSGTNEYILTTSNYKHYSNDDHLASDDLIGYQDYLNLNADKKYKRIDWFWETHPMVLNSINYIKKIVEMTALFADRDRELTYNPLDGTFSYGTNNLNNLELFYDVKTFRKKSKLLNSSYKGTIDYVLQAKIKPRVQKFDFVKIKFYNKLEDYNGNIKYTYTKTNEYDNNFDGYNYGFDVQDKLNLIGLTFKLALANQ